MAEKPKKIIICCSVPGSLINFRGKLIEELVKKNQVYVFVPKIKQPELREKLLSLGITIYENNLLRNNVSVLGDVEYFIQLIKVIRKVKPDIFFSYTFKPVIFGSLAASLCRVKSIVGMLTGLGYTFTEEGRKSLLGKVTGYLLRLSLNSGKNIKIVFQNQDDYNELLNSRIISNRNRSFIVNGSGVDLEAYKCSLPDLTYIEFLMMARLIYAKGVKEYYEAAEIVRTKYPEVRFTLIGRYDGGVNAVSEDLYKKIQSNKVVEYHGWTNDVKPFIKRSSVVVLPSFYREGIPRSVQEGMAAGRAIITTNMVGCKETVRLDSGYQNGFLVPVRDAETLAAKMEYYIENPQQIICHGKNGRKYAEEKFDVNKINKRMLEILEINE